MSPKIWTLLILFGSVFSSALAQSEVESPDYDKIRTITQDKNSEFYYPRLMDRFAANDTTLSLEAYRYLYYGFPMQEDYNPYRMSTYAQKVKEFATGDTIPIASCDSIVKYGLKAIADFPFDTRSMNMLVYAYQCKNDEVNKLLWSSRLRGVLDAIISSGDGETEESAFHVIYPPHEYEIINRFGLQAKASRTIPPKLDYIEVEPNKFEVKGYFFNIEKILEVYGKKYQ